MAGQKVNIDTSRLQRLLGELADALPRNRYKVTFLARYVADPELAANIVMTDDDLTKAVEAIQAEESSARNHD